MGFLYTLLGIAGAFIALMIGMRLYIQFRSSALKGKAAPTLNGKAGQLIRKGKPALFYFYSPACGACKAMTPVVTGMSKTRENVFTVDISKDMETARKFGVMATPTLVTVKNSIVSNILIGPQSPATIENQLS